MKRVPSRSILLPLLWGRQCFNLETCLKLKAGQKSWGMEGNCDWGKRGMVVHWGSEWLFLKKKGRESSSQAENRILKSPSISQEEWGHAMIILRQRKFWIWGLISQTKHVFLKISWTPTTTQQRKKVAAESRVLTDITLILLSCHSNRKQPPSLMGLLQLSCYTSAGHTLLRRVLATFTWLLSLFLFFYASNTAQTTSIQK